MPKDHGFTLVELMIAISIIAILSIIGITVYGGVQKSARDARRRADVNAISKVFEMNHSSGSSDTPYPKLTNDMFAGNTLPKDPATGGDYDLSNAVGAANRDRAGSTYWVCANLENGGGNDSGGARYCLHEQQ